MPIKADIPIAWWAQHKSFKCHDRTQLIPNASKKTHVFLFVVQIIPEQCQ